MKGFIKRKEFLSILEVIVYETTWLSLTICSTDYAHGIIAEGFLTCPDVAPSLCFCFCFYICRSSFQNLTLFYKFNQY